MASLVPPTALPNPRLAFSIVSYLASLLLRHVSEAQSTFPTTLGPTSPTPTLALADAVVGLLASLLPSHLPSIAAQGEGNAEVDPLSIATTAA